MDDVSYLQTYHFRLLADGGIKEHLHRMVDWLVQFRYVFDINSTFYFVRDVNLSPMKLEVFVLFIKGNQNHFVTISKSFTKVTFQ